VLDDSPVVLARARGPHGETVLRRRGDVTELVVDGVFAMDSEQTTTEAALATLPLDRLPAEATDLHVVVGGLGLGVTLRTLLDDPRVGRVDVVELDEALTLWVRDGLVPGARGLLDDPRVRLHVGDVGAVVPRYAPATLDAVLLDVDNGPDFLVHGDNAPLYEREYLGAAAATLRPGGVLAVWSADPSGELRDALTGVCGACEEVLLPVRRGRHRFEYAIYLGKRGGAAQ
jgi:spermidine synthase